MSQLRYREPCGKKFCSECGTRLAVACAACGAALEDGVKFCGECGTPAGASVEAPPREAPSAERRLVSVLFADLVGFTRFSEGRDAEDVRELLSRYFDRSQPVDRVSTAGRSRSSSATR